MQKRFLTDDEIFLLKITFDNNQNAMWEAEKVHYNKYIHDYVKDLKMSFCRKYGYDHTKSEIRVSFICKGCIGIPYLIEKNI